MVEGVLRDNEDGVVGVLEVFIFLVLGGRSLWDDT